MTFSLKSFLRFESTLGHLFGEYKFNTKENSDATYWGYHLVLNCAACEIPKITSKKNVDRFTRELVKRIDMKAYGDPQIVKFGTGNKAGFTLVQLIETSNICAHFCDDSGDMYLDVFSCKPFERYTVENTVKEFFNPAKMNGTFLLRNAKDKV